MTPNPTQPPNKHPPAKPPNNIANKSRSNPKALITSRSKSNLEVKNTISTQKSVIQSSIVEAIY